MADAPHDPANDAALMRRAADGDLAAFGELYDRHAPSVLALAGRIVGFAEAPDVAHDVFLEAWLAAREYDASRASVRGWLLLRARSRALDRRARMRRDVPTQSAPPLMPATERQLAVRRALSTLDANVREALELTYFEGLTAAEVAARTGTPEGTVRSRLARGLGSLLRVFSNHEEDQP